MRRTAWIFLAALYVFLVLAPFSAVIANPRAKAAWQGEEKSGAAASPAPTAQGQAGAPTQQTGSQPQSAESSGGTASPAQVPNVQSTGMESTQSPAPDSAGDDVFHIYDTSGGTMLTVTGKEFLYGAIVTEMPLSMHDEALKAQAVAAYTVYSRMRSANTVAVTSDSSCSTGADFTCSTKDWLIYTTKEEMQARWGASFDEYYAHLDAIVNEVYGQALYSNGELACTTFFAISSGNTENACDVWGEDVSYLRAVASPGDVYCEGYLTTVTVGKDDFAALVRAQYGENVVQLQGNPASWLQVQSRTASGTVTGASLGGVTVTGDDVRNLFGLRSADFTAAYADSTFTFTVKGWGHGVGMSQVGADYMARQGSSYTDILAWYYPGTQLQSLS